jgi:hypothetical protein
MRTKYPDLEVDPSAPVDVKLAAPADRVQEEQRNVTVTAWLWYARKESDNDFSPDPR